MSKSTLFFMYEWGNDYVIALSELERNVVSRIKQSVLFYSNMYLKVIKPEKLIILNWLYLHAVYIFYRFEADVITLWIQSSSLLFCVCI